MEKHIAELVFGKTPEELAEKIRSSVEWPINEAEALCRRAGLDDEWDAADGNNFEPVVEKAAEKLGLEIY